MADCGEALAAFRSVVARTPADMIERLWAYEFVHVVPERTIG